MSNISSGFIPILTTRNSAAAARLYMRAFGLKQVRMFDGNEQYIVLARGDAQIHVAQLGPPNPNHAHGAHVADIFCWVDDLTDVLASADREGLAIRRGPEHYNSSPVATTEVVIEVPDGYWFCFAVAEDASGGA